MKELNPVDELNMSHIWMKGLFKGSPHMHWENQGFLLHFVL
jgi:hypothetical protein